MCSLITNALFAAHIDQCVIGGYNRRMLLQEQNYRSYLKSTLVEKIERNLGYSLRALARDLGISPSSLSEVMKGKKNFSAATALSIAQKLGLNSLEQEYFLLLVQIESAKSIAVKENLQARAHSLNPSMTVRDLSVDMFKVIADWYHFAILELTHVAGFSFRAESIAKKLGISTLEAETALDRLLRLELLEKSPKGGYRKTDSHLLSASEVPSGALRKFHQQMLEKAGESLTTQTPKEKIVGSETFALDPKQLLEANRITEEYFQKMVKLSALGKKKSVYHLGVPFFKLTKED